MKSIFVPSQLKVQWAYSGHLVLLQWGAVHGLHAIHCIVLQWVHSAHYTALYAHCTSSWVHTTLQAPVMEPMWYLC